MLVRANRIMIDRSGPKVRVTATGFGLKPNQAGCQISGEMDENGNWIGAPMCVNDGGCTTTCTLQRDVQGGVEHLWCECVANPANPIV